MSITRIKIDQIEQDVMKGRYYTPVGDDGKRQVIHPETNVNNVIDETGKTLKDILTDNASTSKTYTDTKIANLVGSAPETLDTIEEIATALKNNADIVDVLNNSIGAKADKTYVTTELDKKADKTYVDTGLSGKVDTSTFTTELGKKSDKTYVDTQLTTKADVSSVYTKDETDSLVAATPIVKVGTEDVDTVIGLKENDLYIQLI